MQHQIIFCTCPNNKVASQISKGLVEKKLAACVNMIPGIHTIYEWKGELQQDKQVILLIKSRSDKFEDIPPSILALHPYELPEIIAVSIDNARPHYLNSITEILDTHHEAV